MLRRQKLNKTSQGRKRLSLSLNTDKKSDMIGLMAVTVGRPAVTRELLCCGVTMKLVLQVQCSRTTNIRNVLVNRSLLEAFTN